MTFSPEDISALDAEFQRVHGTTASVLVAQLSPETLPSIDAHQRELNECIGSLESLETFYDGIVKKHQNLLEQTKDKRKKLERDFDDCKRKYWSVKKDFERNPSPRP